MHCSGEELLAHLDGELSRLAELRVRRHLQSCWACRTLLAAHEEQIRRMTVEMDEWRFPDPAWAKDAGRRLSARMRELDAQLPNPAPHRRARLFTPLWAALAGAMLIGLTIWSLQPGKGAAPLRPADLIAQAARTETALNAQAVTQNFTVEIAQVRPTVRRIRSELQLWSDSANGRYASRLIGPGGLKHGLWRPEAGREFFYRAQGNHTPAQQQAHAVVNAPLETLADGGLEPEQIEASFIHWLESRSWSPILLTSSVSSWGAQDGAIATAEKLRTSDGIAVVRISARRNANRMVAMLSMEVDSSNYRPRLETIRFETSDRAVEFRLVATDIRPAKSAAFSQAVFQPDLNLGSPLVAGSPTPAPPGNLIAANPPAVVPGPVTLPAESPEMQARYALHQAGACRGEPVNIQQEDGGTRVMPVSGGGAYAATADLATVLGALDEIRSEVSHDLPSPPDGAIRHSAAIRRHLAALKIGDPADPLLKTMVRDHLDAIRQDLTSRQIRPPAAASGAAGNAPPQQVAVSLQDALRRLGDQGGDGATGTRANADLPVVYHALAELEAWLKRQ